MAPKKKKPIKKKPKFTKKLYATFTMAGFEVPVYRMPEKPMNDYGVLGLAYVSGSNPEIQLHECLKGEKFENTLLHEMLHIAADCSGVPLSERQVEGLTGMLRQAARSFKKVG